LEDIDESIFAGRPVEMEITPIMDIENIAVFRILNFIDNRQRGMRDNEDTRMTEENASEYGTRINVVARNPAAIPAPSIQYAEPAGSLRPLSMKILAIGKSAPDKAETGNTETNASMAHWLSDNLVPPSTRNIDEDSLQKDIDAIERKGAIAVSNSAGTKAGPDLIKPAESDPAETPKSQMERNNPITSSLPPAATRYSRMMTTCSEEDRIPQLKTASLFIGLNILENGSLRNGIGIIVF